jgi:ParB family chromosome partitioning protein
MARRTESLATETADPAPAPLTLLVPLADLRPSRLNPRSRVDPDKLKELADSVKAHGILNPLLVRPLEAGILEIVAGERRFKAAQLAQLAVVPVLSRPLTDEQVLEFTLIENLQRTDLSPLDQARGFQTLMAKDPTRHTAGSIAARIGMTERFVWERLKLLDLIKTLQQHLDHGRITIGHAIALSKLRRGDQQRALDVALFVPETGLPLTEGTTGKAISVRELDAWIAQHVRFDPKQAAQAAPLDFGTVARQVDQAKTAARDVAAITYLNFVQPDAREGKTYTFDHWKRADGTEGSKRCEHAVLGVVAVGPDYGQAFDVCLDTACDVHWKKERAAKERLAKTRHKQTVDKGRAEGRAAAHKDASEEKEAAARAAWTGARAQLVKALTAAIAKAPITKLIPIILDTVVADLPRPKTADACVRVVALDLLLAESTRHQAYRDFPRRAKLFGINTAAIVRQAAGGKPKGD